MGKKYPQQEVNNYFILSYEDFLVLSAEVLCIPVKVEDSVCNILSKQHILLIKITPVIFLALWSLNIIKNLQEFSLSQRDNVKNSH